jgi:hypothetical protein
VLLPPLTRRRLRRAGYAPVRGAQPWGSAGPLAAAQPWGLSWTTRGRSAWGSAGPLAQAQAALSRSDGSAWVLGRAAERARDRAPAHSISLRQHSTREQAVAAARRPPSPSACRVGRVGQRRSARPHSRRADVGHSLKPRLL